MGCGKLKTNVKTPSVVPETVTNEGPAQIVRKNIDLDYRIEAVLGSGTFA